MKHVTILALYDVVSASIVDARTIFTGVNEFLLASGREPAFTVDIAGMELFQYYDENGSAHAIDSGMVNRYIQENTGEDFTAKDFRTWAGTLNALKAFKELGEAQTQSEIKEKVVEALEYVSHKLGNTRAVCKKYYVHPVVIDLFEKQSLSGYLAELDKIEKDDNLTGWTRNEEVLMKILRTA